MNNAPQKFFKPNTPQKKLNITPQKNFKNTDNTSEKIKLEVFHLRKILTDVYPLECIKNYQMHHRKFDATFKI